MRFKDRKHLFLMIDGFTFDDPSLDLVNKRLRVLLILLNFTLLDEKYPVAFE